MKRLLICLMVLIFNTFCLAETLPDVVIEKTLVFGESSKLVPSSDMGEQYGNKLLTLVGENLGWWVNGRIGNQETFTAERTYGSGNYSDPILVSSITLNYSSCTIGDTNMLQLTASIKPSNANNKNVTWTSSNTSVATVDSNGLVTAKGKGTATITCTAKDGSGVKATCKVTVNAIYVKSLSIDRESCALEEGEVSQLHAIIEPSNTTYYSLTWQSSNNSVATINESGYITAVNAGTATITCKLNMAEGSFFADPYEKTATCFVTVTKKKEILVTGITLSSNSVSLNIGSTYQLTPIAVPENATNKAVSWSSDNTTIATVNNNGLVSAINQGTATITCSAKDGSGVKATCQVTVTPIMVSSITLNQSSCTIEENNTFQLVAAISPSNASNTNLTWTSSNTSIATVDSKGLVTAKGEGIATITCTSNDGSGVKATCIMTVTKKVNPENNEPYAVYQDGVLTFFYDDKKGTREGTVYELNNVTPGWYNEHRTEITKAVFDNSFAGARPTSTYLWFAVDYNETSNLTEIQGIQNLNTSNVMYMNSMFYHCSSLTNLDVSYFDTGNVTNMRSMFMDCSSLTSLDLSNFDTGKLTDMGSMFMGCSSLTSLELSNFDTRNVTDMGWMFCGCSSLTNLDLSNFNTENVTYMRYMFSNCSSLTSLNLKSFNAEKVTDMLGIFSRCSSLTNLDLSHFDTERVTDMGSMFMDCSSLTNLDLSHFDTRNVTSMASMFYGCSSLMSLDLSNFDTGRVTNMGSMFKDCSSLTSLDLSNFDTRNVTSMGFMFDNCNSLTSLDVSSFNTVKVTSMARFFSDCNHLKNLDLSHFNTENVSDISYMFASCSGLTCLDLSNFNTGNVTNMACVFAGCSSLTNLDVSHFNTGNVTDMGSMFSSCSSLTNLDLSHFDTKKVTYMRNMFYDCSSLTSLDLSHFDLSNITNTSSMLQGCSSLKSLSVSSSMETIDAQSCNEIGTTSSPCVIIAPNGFNFGTDTSGNFFIWAGGYFCLRFTPGDVNNDGSIDISDVVALVNIILGNAEQNAAADVNGDGSVDISDVVTLVNMILNGTGTGSDDNLQAYLTCPDENHPHLIDLGLPSGTKWACCNVGAANPEDYGGYYAWGETEEKSYYNWSTYIHCDGSEETCHDLGSDIAGTQYDVAHVKWGGSWVMPSREQQEELRNYCTYSTISINGINCGKFTGQNGGTIFLPLAGYRLNEGYGSTGSYGDYWSSTQHPLYSNAAYRYLGFYSEDYYWDYRDRFYGFTVRPVVEDFVLSPIILSSSTLNLIVGKEETISITSGSGYYIIKNNDETIATATIQGNSITVTAVKAGTTTITVTDTRNGQTATIEVTVTDSFSSCPDNHHPHIIDLGLPSGTKWACCNVGASSPEAYGGYYAWGETEEKDVYNEVSYLYSTGEDTNDDGWYDDESDYTNIGSSICDTGYDVAHVKWGEGWSMPSIEQIEELVNSVSCLWITLNGTDGYLFTGPNGNSVFLPACGSRYADQTAGSNSYGDYWSGTLYPSIEGNNRYAYYMDFYKGTVNHNNYWGRTFGHSIRPVYDPSFFFSLSDDTVNVFAHSTATVNIELGGGDYELQNDNPDIVDAEVILADKNENPDAKDEISIYGIAEGSATLSVLNNKNNKTASIVVNVKTPTAEDIAETEDYINRVKDYMNQLGEIPLETFQTDLLSWLENQEWIKDVKSSAETIAIKFKNGLDFCIQAIKAEMFGIGVVSWELPSYSAIDVSSVGNEKIIDSPNVLYIQGRTMPRFNQKGTADRENSLILQSSDNSPVHFNITPVFKSLSFLEYKMNNYDLILLGQTHGGFSGGNKNAGFFQVEASGPFNYNNASVVLAIENGYVKPSDREPIVFNVLPINMQNLNIKNNTIFYGNYCHSYFLLDEIPQTTFFGYKTTAWYENSSYQMAEFFYNMSHGQTYESAISKMLVPYDHVYNIQEGKVPTVPYSNNKYSKQRYFSISTENVIYSETGNPIIKGKINGYKNLKSDIDYYVYAFKGQELNKDNIVKKQLIDKSKIKEEDGNGTFSHEFTSLPVTEFEEEYQVVVGFEYGGIIYYGPIKTIWTKVYKECPDENHPHMIDLGLPSGTLWQCCNEGASKPEDFSGYYQFGEVSSAPSLDQIKELVNKCSYSWTTLNGVRGGLFTGPNGGTIFLPAAGDVWIGELDGVGSYGDYWSSTPRGVLAAYSLYFSSNGATWHDGWYDGIRSLELSVRPVR